MTSAHAPSFTQTDALLHVWTEAGFKYCYPPILQPASVFLELSGEEFRGRLYFTEDGAGNEYCLRPEFTIPVCRAYLASPQVGKPAAFFYNGTVFRADPHSSGEFTQAGIESFARRDKAAADAEILALAVQAAKATQAPQLAIRMGDTALFTAVLDALNVSDAWRRRILRGHRRGRTLTQILERPALQAEEHDHSGVLSALEGVDKKGARALVEDLLSIAGISTVGGRSIGEIADRFLDRAALRAGEGFPETARNVFEKFLAIQGTPDAALTAMHQLAKEAKLDLAAVLEEFETRIGFFNAFGLDSNQFHFATHFARNLDYYTGFVFEARPQDQPQAPAAIAGGRYDRLLGTLSKAEDLPAVGAAIWVDRLGGSDK